MVDSFTNNRNLTQPLVGGDSGTWGGFLNSGVMAQLDLVLGATQAISMTSSDVTLSIPQWNNAIINLTGALTGDHSLVLPFNVNSGSVAVGGLFVVANNTTGAHTVTVLTQASGSTGVTVAQGTRALLYSDTTSVWNADDSKLQIIPFAGNPNGSVAGTAASVNNPPSMVWDYTDALLYICTTTGNAAAAVWTLPVSPVTRGFDTAVNLELTATHTGGNLLSVAVKTLAGIDPTALSPVIVPFQTVSGANTTGAVTSVSVTSALSMTTNTTGATLGSANNTPFRIWLALFNNGGTAVLGMLNASTTTAVFPIAEYGVASTTAVSGAATSAGVWYTPNGTTLSSKAYRIIGYCEYTIGLATAGTYTSDPNNVVIFGPGVKKPGDVIQLTSNSTTTAGTTNASSYTALTSSQSLSITPTSTVNPVRATVLGCGSLNLTSIAYVRLVRGGSTAVGNPCAVTPTGNNSAVAVNIMALDTPNSTSQQTYSFQGKQNGGGGVVVSYPDSTTGSYLQLEEIMG